MVKIWLKIKRLRMKRKHIIRCIMDKQKHWITQILVYNVLLSVLFRAGYTAKMNRIILSEAPFIVISVPGNCLTLLMQKICNTRRFFAKKIKNSHFA